MFDNPVTGEGARADGDRALARPQATVLVEDDLFAPAASVAENPTSTALPIRGMLRYKGTIAIGCLAVALPALTLVWTMVQPVYRARATVEVSPTNPRVLYKTEDNGLIPMYQQYLNSQVGIIAGNRVLQRVVERKDVQATSWYARRPWLLFGGEGSSLERLRTDLEVSPRARTFLIDIDFAAEKPADARIIVNSVLEEYEQEARDRVEDTDVLVLGALQQTLRQLDNSIAGHEKVVEELRRELGTNMPDELTTQKRLRLDQLMARYEQVCRDLELVKWEQQRRQPLPADDQNPEEEDPESDQLVASDAVHIERHLERDAEWWRLHIALEEKRTHLQADMQRLGEQHPSIVNMQAQMHRIEQQMADREAKLRERGFETLPVDTQFSDSNLMAEMALADRVAMLQKEKALLSDALQDQQRTFATEFDKAAQLVRENEDLSDLKSKAALVRARLDEKETERGPAALTRVVSRPMVPSQPYRDRRMMFSAAAMLAGLATGLALALLRALISQTINTADDLTATGGHSLLGLLPVFETASTSGAEPSLIEQEHYRMLRTALLSRMNGHGGTVALVTSGSAGAGKTTVAVSLARSLARCGKRVLLVDADVRAPSVAKYLGIRCQPGLLEVLRGQASEHEAILPSVTRRLDVLPAGRSAADEDTELLANGVFGACLTRFRQQYDVVLLDSPPVLPVADARILSRHADGTILVVREGRCRQPEVQDTVSLLSVAGGRLFGTVYIGSRPSKRYYGYGYPTYGAQQTLEASAVEAGEN